MPAVTFEEARAELGIGDDAGPNEARRAYLKLLKTRKPEVDPEGFMRLREAYELVRSHAEMMAAVQAAVARAASRDASAEASRPESEPVKEIVGAQTISAEPAQEEQEEPPRPIADDEPQQQKQEQGGDEPGTHDEPTDTNDEPAPPPDEPEKDPSAPPPGAFMVEGMMQAGQPAAAASLLEVMFEDAKADPRAYVPSIPRTLSVLFALHAEGDSKTARKLWKSASGWMRETGQEARVLRGEGAALWAIARELSALPGTFPKGVRKAIARAAKGGDLLDAKSELMAFQRRRPSAAKEAAYALRDHAPMLASSLAGALEPPAREATDSDAPAGTQRRGRSWNGWAVAAVALALIRVLMYLARDSTPAQEPSRTRLPAPSFFDGGIRMPGEK